MTGDRTPTAREPARAPWSSFTGSTGRAGTPIAPAVEARLLDGVPLTTDPDPEGTAA